MYHLCFQEDDKTFSILAQVYPCACTCEGERMTLRKSHSLLQHTGSENPAQVFRQVSLSTEPSRQ